MTTIRWVVTIGNMGSASAVITDKRLANLRPPWKKGESGNRRGAPGVMHAPSLAFTAICREYLAEPFQAHDDRTRARMLVESLYDQAMNGSVKAAMVILDRVDPIEKTGNIGNTARIIVNMIAERVGITLPESATALTPIDVTVGDSAMAQPIDVTPISNSANG